MKRLLTAILALIMALSICACAKPDEGGKINDKPSEPEEDGLVTLYQMTSQTYHNADGSEGYWQRRYTYDDKGNLLAVEYDMGEGHEVWHEDIGIYEYVFDPFDGTVESAVYFMYTEDGHIRFSNGIEGPATESGKLLDGLEIANDLYYTYLDDGRIDTIEEYKFAVDGPAYDEPTISYKCSYNANKQLTSVVCTSPYEEGSDNYLRIGDWYYDDQGRMIEERYYIMEGTRCYRYTYNDQGSLETADFGWVNVDRFGNPEDEEVEIFNVSTKIFTYDENGRLTEFGYGSVCYDDQGRVTSIGDVTITYLADGGKKIVEPGEDGDDVYLFDEHGNLIRHTRPDGTYSQMEYREIRVTEAEAERLKRFNLLRSGAGYYDTRYYAYEHMSTIDFPRHALYDYEVLLERGIRY